MSHAEHLFKKFQSFKEVTISDTSPEDTMHNYIKDVLGSIERVHYDFKIKRDRRKHNLDDDDRKNIAKAVSGFANTSGGILIWGIEDKTLKRKPIKNELFLSNCLELANSCTDPILPGIDGIWIPSAESIDIGYAIIYIPESQLPPHRVVLNDRGKEKIKDKYYMRSADSFFVAGHTQLEDMFGRRPRPTLSLSINCLKNTTYSDKKMGVDIYIGIQNKGRGSAIAPYLELKLFPPYSIDFLSGVDGNGNFGLPRLPSINRRSEFYKFGSTTNYIIHPGVCLDVFKINFLIDYETQTYHDIKDLNIEYKIAAAGIRIVEGRSKKSQADFMEVIRDNH